VSIRGKKPQSSAVSSPGYSPCSRAPSGTSNLAEQGVNVGLCGPLAVAVGRAWRRAPTGEGIADAPVGLNHLLREVAIDLAPQGTDVDINDVGQALERGVPYMLKNHGAGHWTIGVSNQVFEQQEFFRAQIDGFSQARGSSLYQIQLQISGAQHID
jgi:hypothetical protein